jgi:hypothetical protein
LPRKTEPFFDKGSVFSVDLAGRLGVLVKLLARLLRMWIHRAVVRAEFGGNTTGTGSLVSYVGFMYNIYQVTGTGFW